MLDTCTHLDAIRVGEAGGDGCIDYLCYADEVVFTTEDPVPSPAHP